MTKLTNKGIIVLTKTQFNELLNSNSLIPGMQYYIKDEIEEVDSLNIDTEPTTGSGNLITSGGVAGALENFVVGGSYNNDTKSITLTLKNGSSVEIMINGLINGLVSNSSIVSGSSNTTDDNTIPTTQNVVYRINEAIGGVNNLLGNTEDL